MGYRKIKEMISRFEWVSYSFSTQIYRRRYKICERMIMCRQIFNRSVKVGDIDIFYRETGDRKNPAILLLHGFPTSSVMSKNLMFGLSDKFHLIAPDYPGFGFSDFPNRDKFEYSFKNVSAYISRFTEEIDLKSFTIYPHDYGCPIGLRICVNHPERLRESLCKTAMPILSVSNQYGMK